MFFFCDFRSIVLIQYVKIKKIFKGKYNGKIKNSQKTANYIFVHIFTEMLIEQYGLFKQIQFNFAVKMIKRKTWLTYPVLP